MPNRVSSLVPMAHVRSVAASVAFYEGLGFEVESTFTPPGQAEPSWASLTSGGAGIMVTLRDVPVEDLGGVLFYCYCDDVPAMREHLINLGHGPGPIQCPFYMPKGEFRITDPDGYVVMVAHTG